MQSTNSFEDVLVTMYPIMINMMCVLWCWVVKIS